MIFQKKRAGIMACTATRCDSCGADATGPFCPGDYIYKDVKCKSCGGAAVIYGIFGREFSGGAAPR